MACIPFRPLGCLEKRVNDVVPNPPPAGDRVGSDPVARHISRAGFVSLVCYAAVLGLSFQFHYGEGHRNRPIPAVLVSFLVAFVAYLAVTRRLLVRSAPPSAVGPSRLRLIVGYAVAFRLLLLPSAPIQEIDYYRYLWDGQVTASGVNPFRYSANQIEELGPAAPTGSELARLWDLANRSATVRTVFDRVHHREVPTIYPPAAQVVFAAVATVTPADASLGIHTLVLKLFLLAFDLGTLAVVVAILRRFRLPDCWCVGYAWCPLVMKELSNSAHLDAIAVFFATAAFYAFVSIPRRPTAGAWKPAAAGGCLLGLGVLAKSYPVVLGPVVAAYLLARLGWRGALPLAACAAVVLGGYAPFLSTHSAESGNTPVTGLGTFLGRWEMNDFLFMLVHENVRPASAGGSERWFVLTPDGTRARCVATVRDWIETAGYTATDKKVAFLLTQGLMGLVLTALVLRLAVGVYRRPTRRRLLRAAFLTLGWAWLMTSAANPWYLLWGLPLLVFAGRRAWWLLPGLALGYYVRFWMEYQAAGTEDSLRAAHDLFDFGIVWLEYLPFFALFAVETYRTRPRGRRTRPT